MTIKTNNCNRQYGVCTRQLALYTQHATYHTSARSTMDLELEQMFASN